jgi:nitroreductase
MPELHPLLATRWSPRSFNPDRELTEAELAVLLEAARWAPSCDNSQPWRFLIGRRGTETHKRVLVNLNQENQCWAGTASVLLVGAHLADPALRHAAYDLGQAMAHLGFQAAALGLYLHQIAGFAAGPLAADLELPEHVTPRVVAAIGRLGDPDHLPHDLRVREISLRTRRPLAELLL